MRQAVVLSMILLVALPAVCVVGCAGLEKRGVGPPTREAEAEGVDTRVQTPSETGADRRMSVAFPPEKPAPVISAVPDDDSLPAAPAPPESASLDIRHVSGYRVQVYATREPEKAKAFAESARPHFGEKVYVEYLEPYYKVRLGDCLTREEARLLQDRAKAAGFDEAWVTATLVIRAAGNAR
ncbi:MAG: SPOR domain-containing protein [Candidatus Eisenbacteria bacterium]